MFDGPSCPPGEVCLRLTGAFDSAACAELRPCLESLAVTQAAAVRLDLGGVTLLDGSGVGAIGYLYRRLGRRLTVTGATGQPRDLLQSLGLAAFLHSAFPEQRPRMPARLTGTRLAVDRR